LGYQINPSFAVEGQYQNLGKYKLTEPAVGSLQVKDSGVSLAAVGFLPLTKDFSLIGKAGIAVRKLKAELIDLGVTETDSKTKSALMLGFGVEYSISPALSVRAEYEYFGNPKFDDTKIKGDLVSVGLRYRF
jgi:OOP family OmpA-OmpF porin